MNALMLTAFRDELEKIAGIRSFFGGGFSAIGRRLANSAERSALLAKGIKPEALPAHLKDESLWDMAKRLYTQGKGPNNSVWEGLKNVARNEPGQVAAAVGVPLAGGAIVADQSARRRYPGGY